MTILNIAFLCFRLFRSWFFHGEIKSYMHNFTLFSREKEWNLICFHFFREMKSEKIFPFILFEKWKVKWFFVSLFSRSESEIRIPRDRDREVKFQKKSREFSRNETLAGYWHLIVVYRKLNTFPSLSPSQLEAVADILYAEKERLASRHSLIP